MTELPPRLWIVGPCGSGKSTLATRLATRLGIAATHIGDLNWQPGWVEAPREETVRRLAEIVGGPRWVIDGNYRELRSAHHRELDLVLWLDLAFWITLPRLLGRTFSRSFLGTPCCNGNRESLARAFLNRESILLWGIRTHRHLRRQLTQELTDLPHVRFRSQREIERWIALLPEFASSLR